MYSTLRSSLFFKTKITTNHTAIYRKKKAFHKAFGKNDRFFTTNKTFESPQTKALFFLQQKLHQSQTEAPPTTNRSSANHQQSIRSIPTPSPASWKKKKNSDLRIAAPFIHPHPSARNHTPCASHKNGVPLQKFKTITQWTISILKPWWNMVFSLSPKPCYNNR